MSDKFAKFVVGVQFPPFPLSDKFFFGGEGKWLSGQKQWTVNPPNLFFIGSNPIFPKKSTNNFFWVEEIA